MISDFFWGTHKKITVNIKYNGQTPDITNDQVRIIFKKNKDDKDSEALINKLADVSINGSNGQAIIELTKDETKVPTTKYFYEITWALANGEFYVLESDRVRVLDRVSD